MTTNQPLILVTGTSLAPDEVLRLFTARGYGIRRIPVAALTGPDLHRGLRGASGYFLGGEEAPSDAHFEAADALECVAFTGTDYKKFIPGYQKAFDLGIAITNTPGANAVSVAEFTILLMLTMARPFTAQIESPGGPAGQEAAPGHELRGRTLGVIGAGRIGARVARIAGEGLGMRVIYHSRTRNEALEQATASRFVTMAELLAEADVVTLHRPAPHSGEDVTIDQAALARMRPGALLINTVDHRLVDLVALAEAITGKGIRVAFDEFTAGPAWDSLLALGPERFLSLRSMAYNTAEANLRTSMIAATSLCDVLEGQVPATVANPDFLSARQQSGRTPASQNTLSARSATAAPS